MVHEIVFSVHHVIHSRNILYTAVLQTPILTFIKFTLKKRKVIAVFLPSSRTSGLTMMCLLAWSVKQEIQLRSRDKRLASGDWLPDLLKKGK